jgi:hypothetical protein
LPPGDIAEDNNVVVLYREGKDVNWIATQRIGVYIPRAIPKHKAKKKRLREQLKSFSNALNQFRTSSSGNAFQFFVPQYLQFFSP